MEIRNEIVYATWFMQEEILCNGGDFFRFVVDECKIPKRGVFTMPTKVFLEETSPYRGQGSISSPFFEQLSGLTVAIGDLVCESCDVDIRQAM